MASEKCLRILVVEIYPSERAMLVFYLTHLGHRVEAVGSAGAALDRLHQDAFDVLLTSNWRSDTSGRSLLKELAERGELPRRVITMSAMRADEGRALSQAAGAQVHLAKPFPLPELRDALE